ncbi:MAG: FAD binding domain-containing protein [Terriglobales bacterium]
MKAFEYATPKSAQQAVGLLGNNWSDAELLAGGTDLLALMKDDIVSPRRLVNVKQITGLDSISYNARAGLRIGALVRIADFADHADVRKYYPTLARVTDDAASPQIRNLATIAGNLCQRPRCWYFRNGFGLLGQQNGKSLVTAGDNRYHAILGNDGPAYFVSPSSIAPALIAAGARVKIHGPNGDREVPLDRFFVIPKSETEREHDLRPNEMIVEITVPPPSGARTAQYEVRQRAEFDWPLATASVALAMDGNKVRNAMIVLGHVAPVPWISNEARQALAGQPLNEQTAAVAASAAVKPAKNLGKNGYKIRLTEVAIKRAILQAARNSG